MMKTYSMQYTLQTTSHTAKKLQTVPPNLFPTPKLYTTLEKRNNNKFCQVMNGAIILMYYLSIKYMA